VPTYLSGKRCKYCVLNCICGLFIQQGSVVRDLKTAKADKSVVQPQVEKLLQLKAELSQKQGSSTSTVNASSESSSKKSKGKKK
jgi:hypothetical protein